MLTARWCCVRTTRDATCTLWKRCVPKVCSASSTSPTLAPVAPFPRCCRLSCQGFVVITQQASPVAAPVELCRLGPGAYFGEVSGRSCEGGWCESGNGSPSASRLTRPPCLATDGAPHRPSTYSQRCCIWRREALSVEQNHAAPHSRPVLRHSQARQRALQRVHGTEAVAPHNSIVAEPV